MSTRGFAENVGKVWHEPSLIKRLDGCGNSVKWIHGASRHVKRSMGLVITDDVMQASARVADR
jgi:hypothetical protein